MSFNIGAIPCTTPVMIRSWNVLILKVMRFLEGSGSSVNGLFSGLASFLERNLVIPLLDQLLLKRILPIQNNQYGTMWTAQLQTVPVRF